MARSGADPEQLRANLRSWSQKGDAFHDCEKTLETIKQAVLGALDQRGGDSVHGGDPVSGAVRRMWEDNLNLLQDIVSSTALLIEDTRTAFSNMTEGLSRIDEATRHAAKHLAGGTGGGLPGGSGHRS
ncbi:MULTISPECIES: hypothetical protein [Streptomyces]|uniref:WXG100 family type VII secretion target n=1 Tax=Streptomyces canarius TaxID=285453 RepID=A0ABQ3D286_9ACTN|nr:hypothetical protein [Streptomyces canarius]GHA52977.1 hypothetical protein GCM10010345_67170 [Streptomyces canarius]